MGAPIEYLSGKSSGDFSVWARVVVAAAQATAATINAAAAKELIWHIGISLPCWRGEYEVRHTCDVMAITKKRFRITGELMNRSASTRTKALTTSIFSTR